MAKAKTNYTIIVHPHLKQGPQCGSEDCGGENKRKRTEPPSWASGVSQPVTMGCDRRWPGVASLLNAVQSGKIVSSRDALTEKMIRHTSRQMACAI